MVTISISPSPENITRIGEEIYFKNKKDLEEKHFGEFVVIDTDSGDYFVDKDKLAAIQKAQAKHPDKIFYIAEIGNLKQSTIQETREVKKYGLPF